MNSFLLNRQLGSIGPQALAQAQNERLHKALQAAPRVKFHLQSAADDLAAPLRPSASLAHPAGVSSIAIDRFEGR